MKRIHALLWLGGMLLAAAGLTLASLRFIRPMDCRTTCDAPPGRPCPTGACRFTEQRAGLPLPVVVDDPGGGSPTNGWGKLGPEDLPNPATFLVDMGFYSSILWLGWYLMRAWRGKEKPFDWLAVLLPLGWVGICLLLGFVLYRGVLGR